MASRYSMGRVSRSGPQPRFHWVSPTAGLVTSAYYNGFDFPQAVAVDATGNVYIADSDNDVVVKLAPDGTHLQSFNGPALVHSTYGFYDLVGIAVGPSGKIYVSDAGNNWVVSMAANGSVVTVYGTGAFNYFSEPWGVAVDSAEKLYVADTGNNRIVVISPSNSVAWTYLNGNNGRYVAVDSLFNIYVVNSVYSTNIIVSHNVVVMSSAGHVISTIKAGGDIAGIAVDSSQNIYIGNGSQIVVLNSLGSTLHVYGDGFTNIVGVAVNRSGGIYALDLGEYCVKTLSSSGAPLNTFRNGFTRPNAVAVNSAGDLFISDSGLLSNITSGSIVVLSPDIPLVGTPLQTYNGFFVPHGVAVDSLGFVYVNDVGNERIVKLSSKGVVQWTITGFNYPGAIAVGADFKVYIADTNGKRIVVYDQSTGIQHPYSLPTSTVSTGIAVDSSNNIYLSDLNARVLVLNSTGGILKVFTDNFVAPSGVAVDSRGNLYIADSSANRIAVLSLAGVEIASLTSVQGVNNPAGITVDGAGNIYFIDYTNKAVVTISPVVLILSNPFGVAADNLGNVFVADTLNNRVVVLNSDCTQLQWVLTTNVNSPRGVAVDSHGRVYIADAGNDRVLVLYYSDGDELYPPATVGFSQPSGVAVTADGTRVYVADTGNNRVVMLEMGFYEQWEATVFSGPQLTAPTGIAVQSSLVAVTDNGGNRVVVYTLYGDVQWVVYGNFSNPQAVAFDAEGNLVVVDGNTHRVLILSLAGVELSVWTEGFHTPIGVAVSSQGDVYVSDGSLNRVVLLPMTWAFCAVLQGLDFVSTVSAVLVANQTTPLPFQSNLGSYFAINAFGQRTFLNLTTGQVQQNLSIFALAPPGAIGGNDNWFFPQSQPSLDGSGLTFVFTAVPLVRGQPSNSLATMELNYWWDASRGSYDEENANASHETQAWASTVTISPSSTGTTTLPSCAPQPTIQFSFCFTLQSPTYAVIWSGIFTTTGVAQFIIADANNLLPANATAVTVLNATGSRVFTNLTTGVASVLNIVGVLPPSSFQGNGNLLYPGAPSAVDWDGLALRMDGVVPITGQQSASSSVVLWYQPSMQQYLEETANSQHEATPSASNFTVTSYHGGPLPSCDIAGPITQPGSISSSTTACGAFGVSLPLAGAQLSVQSNGFVYYHAPCGGVVSGVAACKAVNASSCQVQAVTNGAAWALSNSSSSGSWLEASGSSIELLGDDSGAYCSAISANRDVDVVYTCTSQRNASLPLLISVTEQSTCHYQFQILYHNASCPSPPRLPSVSSSTGAATGGTSPIQAYTGNLCIISYSLVGNVDYPWSVATSLTFFYNAANLTTTAGTAVALINGTGTRTYTNRFGVSFTTPFTIAAVGTASSNNLLYLGNGFPVDGHGLTWNLSSPVQLPGAGPAVLTSLININNASGVVFESGSSRIDGLGQAVLSSVSGFVNTTIGASNLNSLAANYAACQAPITFTNGLRQPTQPSASNGALQFTYSYFISDGLTYAVQGNLTITTASAFANTHDALGNPFQTVVNVTGLRTYTYLPTGAVVMSNIHGLSTAVPAHSDQRFYPYALLASAPGVYTINNAPFLDGDGLNFALSPSVPMNGLAPGSGTLYSATSVYILSTQNTAVLTEAYSAQQPQPSLQQQSYVL